MPTPISPGILCRTCDPGKLPFTTTAELAPLSEPLGQERAVEAAELAIGIRDAGYNLFVVGPSGFGKHEFVRHILERAAASEPPAYDYCYVHDFEQEHAPRALRLPAGRGKALVGDMLKLVEDLRAAIPAAFESDEYRARAQDIEAALKKRQEEVFDEYARQAEAQGVAMARLPSGVAFAPTKDGDVLSPDEFEALAEDEKRRVRRLIEDIQVRLQKELRKLPQWAKDAREKVRELAREVTKRAVEHAIRDLQERYRDLPEVVAYLDAVEADVIENADDFREKEAGSSLFAEMRGKRDLTRYRINLIIDRDGLRGAPVLYEDHPTVDRLVGRVDQRAQFGSLVSDFTLIKAGALHRANGGYLVIDARKILTQPYAWEMLKRALYAHQVRVESVSQMLGLSSASTLDPEPIALQVKVVLIADHGLYYLLSELDPDVGELFKVTADFEEWVSRDDDSELAYARLLAGLAEKNGGMPLHRSAVSRIIEHGSRLAGDAKRLSTSSRALSDLVREAEHWAIGRGSAVVELEDVDKTIAAKIHRLDRLRDRVREATLRNTLLIDTDGEAVGQVNGLSVISLGDFSFGRATRITATARVGEGKVVDIEREVELGGALHSKGVLILVSYLGSRYAREYPLSLAGSLVFEQSYGGVEGDSASLAELCALLSALAELPVTQALAITGSVNQHGEVQAIGGINEKVEGFFDLCRARGLNGEQGVIIPESNREHLMLKKDVVDACRAGQFAVYSVRGVDEAMELLTGVTAGEQDEDGEFPEESINGKVLQQLVQFAIVAQGFAKMVKAQLGEDGDDDTDQVPLVAAAPSGSRTIPTGILPRR